MNIAQSPELVDRLAAHYALGSLRGGARRRFEQLARQHPALRAAALTWEGRLSGLTEIQAPSTPPPAVWTRIDNLVQADLAQQRAKSPRAAAAPHPAPWWQSLGLWRGAALASLAVAAVTLNLVRQERNELQAQLAALQGSEVSLVAVLNDGQAQPQLLATYNPRQQVLTVQRVGQSAPAADRDWQLWAVSEGRPPTSLGLLREGVVRIPIDPPSARMPALAVSLEPRGGAPAGSGPTGPVLMSGALVRRAV